MQPSDKTPARLRLFEATGIELEYMIVGRESLEVLPISDALLQAAAGALTSDFEDGQIGWSNELVLHVIELKTNGPAANLLDQPALFQASLARIDALLEPLGARLMPTAMHPWMEPLRETRLWPHDASVVYEAFDRIFDCRGHGWSNLQSMHINLPFADDAEFARLHAAIRTLLPILPALSASSPFVEGRATGIQDNRMRFYRGNAARIPSVAGLVVPERMSSRAEYEGVLLERIYNDLAPHDPEGVLRYEFANSRGAIARFDRYAIEIRVLDVQECPLADLAIAALVRDVLGALVAERWSSQAKTDALATEELAEILWRCVEDSGEARVSEPAYLAAFGLEAADAGRTADIWRRLMQAVWSDDSPQARVFRAPVELILEQGTLSRRILRATGPEPSRERLAEVYRELCDCLRDGEGFERG